MCIARYILAISIFLAGLVLPGQVRAQVELSLYGGAFSTSEGRKSGQDSGGFLFSANWSGGVMSGQSDYGLRVTWWQNETYGWGLDLSHASFPAANENSADNNLNTLDLSRDLNLFTINAYRRWKAPERTLVPYVGAGLGMTIPDISFDSDDRDASGLQAASPAIQWVAGSSYAVTERVSVFGEYRGNYSMNSADPESGGTLGTSVLTNAFNVGLSLGF